jgi:hypothetical protein
MWMPVRVSTLVGGADMCNSQEKRQPSEPDIDSWLQAPQEFYAFQAYHKTLKDTYVIRKITYSFRDIIQQHHSDVGDGYDVMVSEIELMTPRGVPSKYTWQPRNNEGDIRELEISQFTRFRGE